jgi:hypothetical protein
MIADYQTTRMFLMHIRDMPWTNAQVHCKGLYIFKNISPGGGGYWLMSLGGRKYEKAEEKKRGKCERERKIDKR